MLEQPLDVVLFAKRQTFHRGLIDVIDIRQDSGKQRPSSCGQEDQRLSRIAIVTGTARQPEPLQLANGAQRGRCRHMHALAELPETDPVFLPERAQERPQAEIDAMGGNPGLKRPVKGPDRIPDQKSDGFFGLVGRQMARMVSIFLLPLNPLCHAWARGASALVPLS